MNPCAPAESLPDQACLASRGAKPSQAKAGRQADRHIHPEYVGSSAAFVWNAKMIRSLVIESLVVEHTKPSWINSLAPVAPASLANFNTRQGRERERMGRREKERGERERARQTKLMCDAGRQQVYHLQPVKFIFVQPRLVMRYGKLPPTSCTRIRISTANPDSPNPKQVSEFWQNQKVASANRLEAFRALANENTFIFTSHQASSSPF